jgi:polyhydroxyalkanoate synthesis regulator phasin
MLSLNKSHKNTDHERRKTLTMFKTKKAFILVPVLAVVLSLCVGVGLVMANDSANPQGPGQEMMDRVAQILGIDKQDLSDAFKQAQDEFEAQRIDKLVEDGKITQEQADQLNAWEAARPAPGADQQTFEEWQNSRPDVPGLEPPGPPQAHGNMDEMLSKLVDEGKITQEQADQLKAWEAEKPDPSADQETFGEWLKSRPDVPFLDPPGSPPCHQNPDPSSIPPPTTPSTN